MQAHDGGSVVVLAEEQGLPLEACQRRFDGGDLLQHLGDRRLVTLLGSEFEEHLSVFERCVELVDLLDRLFMASQTAGDLESALLIVPQVRGRSELSQLNELRLLAGDVKGTSGHRRAGSGDP